MFVPLLPIAFLAFLIPEPNELHSNSVLSNRYASFKIYLYINELANYYIQSVIILRLYDLFLCDMPYFLKKYL